MTRATWNGSVVAESDSTVVVEGNHYFPRDSVSQDLVEPSETTTRCGWKGTATYFHLVVDGKRNADAAWTYEDPLDAAQEIRGRVAFWKGVEVTD